MKRWDAVKQFWSHVEPEPNTGCFLWIGNQTRGAYGSVWWKGRQVRAHRFAWELANGPIPDQMHVLHRCDVRWCVNVAHLFLGTNTDNVRDMIAKGRDRTPASAQRRRMHCPNGHPYDRIEHDGRRRCSICYVAVRRRADARYRAAHNLPAAPAYPNTATTTAGR